MPVVLQWSSLQSHHGDVANSFEHLCAILAHRESGMLGDAEWTYVRNGRPDGGVECYWRHPTKGLHAFQAKYFRESLGSSQWSQLTASLQQALRAYPQLSRYTVCLPQDLPHSPSADITTAREKWDKWRSDRIAEALEAGRPLEIDLWGEHELTTKLADPRNRGLLNFFFARSIFTPERLSGHLQQQIARAGVRYQPAIHVENELEVLFEWLAATPTHRAKHAAAIASARRLISNHRLSLPFTDESEVGTALIALANSLAHAEVALALPQCSGYTKTVVDAWGQWGELRMELMKYAPHKRHAMIKQGEVFQLAGPAPLGEREWLDVDRFLSDFSEIEEELFMGFQRRLAEAAENRSVLISGNGGCGKTHLMCRVASNASSSKVPAVLILGQQLDAAQPWSGILGDFGEFANAEQFLDALDVAGESHGCRSLLLIDALNEAENNHRWPSELRGLLATASEYPHVVVVLTIRDAYEKLLLPKPDTPSSPWKYVRHRGFEIDNDKALARYCDHYHLTQPDVPQLNPEFHNPLFLSTFCRAFGGEPDPEHRRPAKPFPGGHAGFSELFDQLLGRWEDDLKERFPLDLDRSLTPLRTAVRELADLMCSSPRFEVGVAECTAILQQHIIASPSIPNLLGLLESMGLLLRVTQYDDDHEMTETVQFAYDRMGAHFIASRLLPSFASAREAKRFFGSAAAAVARHQSTYFSERTPSLMEALLILWRERYGEELFDACSVLVSDDNWRDAFLRGLLVASTESVGPRVAKWLGFCLSKINDEAPEQHAYLIESLLSRIGNPALIETVHHHLSAFSMAERDAWWTIHLRDFAEDSSLVSWPFRRKTVRLAEHVSLAYATSLAWLATTTTLRLRAVATKAITAILDTAPTVIPALLKRFRNVNDVYVLQSVCMAAYGACLRSIDARHLRTCAEVVLELWPDKNAWPVDLHCRYAVSGIVEVAAYRNPDWNVDLAKVKPPYGSRWIEPSLSWESAEALADEQSNNGQHGFNDIVRSCTPESRGVYGDFGRYTVGTACYRFRNVGRSSAEPFAHDTPHRFIIQRVLELGWNPNDFSEFDRTISNDRGTNFHERMGKKYQWQAFYEFLARAADNFPFSNAWSSNPNPQPYEHPRQLIYEFWVDTSVLRVADEETRYQHQKNQWWDRRVVPGFWNGTSDNEWLLTDADVPDPAQYLIQNDPGGMKTCALLCGGLTWKDYHPEDAKGDSRRLREVRLYFRAFGIHPNSLGVLQAWMKKEKAVDLPRPLKFTRTLFGELLWSRSAQLELGIKSAAAFDPWWRHEHERVGPPCDLLPLADDYLSECDPAFGNHLRAHMPSRWLAQALGLRAGPQEFAFMDSSGKAVCWNPSLEHGGSDACLIELPALVAALRQAGLALVWCVTGEKMALRRNSREDGPALPWIQGLYQLKDDRIVGSWSFEPDCRR